MFSYLTPEVITALGFGYFMGAIPFGLLLTKMAGLGDVRKIGSGNIGATNVLRTGNKGLALATLLLDGGKGAAAYFIFISLYPDLTPRVTYLVCLAAFLGHLFPVWLKFKGGKGVATFLGNLLAVAWPVGIATMATWGIVALLFRMSSLAALVAAALSPVLAWYLGDKNVAMIAVVMAVFIAFAHRANIRRILQGTEPKIGAK